MTAAIPHPLPLPCPRHDTALGSNRSVDFHLTATTEPGLLEMRPQTSPAGKMPDPPSHSQWGGNYAVIAAHMTAEVPIEAFETFIAGPDHPECMAFDSHGELWVGTDSGQILRITADRKVLPVAHVGGFCAALAFSPKDELVASVPAIGLVRVSPNGDVSTFGSHPVKGVRCGVFDSTGTLYATVPGQWGKKNGHVLRIKSPGEVQVLAGPRGYFTGMALSGDGNQLYVIESDTNSIFRFAVEPDGTLGTAELFAKDCGRFPIGLALDSEGSLLVSCFASDEIWRIDAVYQKTLVACDEWSLRLSSPTCLAFGGPELAELYVCNIARPHIARARVGRKGQAMVNQRARRVVKPRPAPL